MGLWVGLLCLLGRRWAGEGVSEVLLGGGCDGAAYSCRSSGTPPCGSGERFSRIMWRFSIMCSFLGAAVERAARARRRVVVVVVVVGVYMMQLERIVFGKKI